MKESIRQRTISTARFILERRTTLRDTAKVFGIGKSTLHTDLTKRLPRIDRALAKEVHDILRYNHDCRHIRGGESTRKKYLQEKEALKGLNH